MKKQLKTLSQNIALIVLFAASFSLVTFHTYGQQTARLTPGGRGYYEYLPPGYAASTGLFPTIIFRHGSGERGDGSPSQITKVTAQGTPKFIKNGATMCFVVNGVNECFIVLS